jgi:hypothetical protein
MAAPPGAITPLRIDRPDTRCRSTYRKKAQNSFLAGCIFIGEFDRFEDRLTGNSILSGKPSGASEATEQAAGVGVIMRSIGEGVLFEHPLAGADGEVDRHRGCDVAA